MLVRFSIVKTTLIINDGIMKRLKEQAARQGKTISELVESALRLFLQKQGGEEKLPPLPKFDGGRCLVDVADRDGLYRAMEGR